MSQSSRVGILLFVFTKCLSLSVVGCEPAEDPAEDVKIGDAFGDTDTDTNADNDSDTGTDTDDDGHSDVDWAFKDCDVDLMFVIDNSLSMGDYQTALGLAFGRFAEALGDALPAETNVHVGVTSTEMGYSQEGQSKDSNGVCTFTGDGGQNETAFYITPEQTDTGVNGAQGRLYKPEGQPVFFDIDIGASAAEVADLEEWFKAAAAVGTGGSNIEMLTAPVGWVGDPANAATNAGFIRDERTVMVVFFMQDEADQTPVTLEGKNGGQAMLDRLVGQKSVCGGLNCIVAGGFLRHTACGGTRPINTFLDGLTRPVSVEPLPAKNLTPQELADKMAELLTTTLLEVIKDTCEDIGSVM